MLQIWARTTFFQVEPGEEEQTNPGVYGRAFAHWLAEKLKARGEAVREILPEDWGWCVILARSPYLLWIGCSNREGGTEEWGAFVTAEPGFLRRILRKPDTQPAIDRIQRMLLEIMKEIPGVTKVWSEG
ncbi:MAG TPA: hypothetical protein DEP35_18395 [Deltaproteobacteria bacterium]|nr:hypothetical protein [Deltaproteobacteria bacterium]